jgi:hypothetical protein
MENPGKTVAAAGGGGGSGGGSFENGDNIIREACHCPLLAPWRAAWAECPQRSRCPMLDVWPRESLWEMSTWQLVAWASFLPLETDV